jgi:hypothetical protein
LTDEDDLEDDVKVVPFPTKAEIRDNFRKANTKPPKTKPVKLRFSYRSDDTTDNEGNKVTRLGLDAHFARNGRFYGICAIFPCDNPNFKAWYIEMLIPGGWADFTYLCNPVDSIAEAKKNARVIVETVIADFQGINLIG